GEIFIDDCTPVDLLVIPNTFTPNDDGAHETWIIQNIEMFPNAEIQVFDRWGRLVFHGSAGDIWDGTGPNGKDLPVENYYYVIDLNAGGDDILTGTVSIVR
ncbi:MAG TPA: gliding motility-associated C-terminal domain-containing protein, partial [Bacteroidales bacterium]|nr:gliding motility-associated C-terminal domain-containing protein [Bacteroidales bacterium]